MNKNIENFDYKLCDKLFNFVYSDEENMSQEEVRAELQRLNIDTRSTFSKLQMALADFCEKQKAQELLKSASEKRVHFLKRFEQIKISNLPNFRSELQTLITKWFSGSQQAAYYRKLESAASDKDLKSLFEDIMRLDELSKEENNGPKP